MINSASSTSSSRVFLSYTHEDIKTVKMIYEELKLRNVNVWFDKINLGPGEWKPEILRAIRRSHYFIFCLSQAALSKVGDEPGFQDAELNEAYNIAIVQDPAQFTIIPLRLEDCDRGDNRLSQFQQFDLFLNWDNVIDRLAVYFGGQSLTEEMGDDRTEKDKRIEAFEGRALAFHYAGENEKVKVAIKPLINILQNKEEESSIRYAAILAIRRIRPEAKTIIEPLIQALQDKDQRIYRSASETLLSLELKGNKSIVEPLICALANTKNSQVRFSAAAAIGKIGSEAEVAVKPLVRTLRDKDWKVRRITAEALGSIGPKAKSAIGPLIEILKEQSNNEWVRSNSASALAKIGPETGEVTEVLSEASNDNSAKVRDAASKALKQCRNQNWIHI